MWRGRESCSDHNILNFKIASVNNGKGKTNYTWVRYIIKQKDYKKFDTILATNFISTFNCINSTVAYVLNEELQGKVQQYNTEDPIHDCLSCVTAACNTAFQISKGRKLKTRKRVPWWNNELKILRKKVNALRRRYQRTLNNEDFRSERKVQYNEGNDNTNGSCRKKNLNPGKNTAFQLRSPTLGMQFTK